MLKNHFTIHNIFLFLISSKMQNLIKPKNAKIAPIFINISTNALDIQVCHS